MIVFRLARPLEITRQRLRQRLTPPAAAHGLFVTTPDDLAEILDSIPATQRASLQRVADAAITGVPEAPARLGQGPGEATPVDPALLPSRLPRDRPARLAVINGFGTGIGDTLVGMTAWRCLLSRLATTGVREVEAALWVRPRAIRNAAAVCARSPGIARCLVLPAPADAFLTLDAYWDFSGLAGRPGFHELPLVDLMLGLLGLDPAGVPAADKRNRLGLDPAVADELDALLGRVGRDYVLLHSLSSNPIREMPTVVAHRLIGMLHRRLGLPVVTTIGGLPPHPALLDLSAQARGFDRLCVFVARARGMLTVDTSTYHIADAFDVPSVVAFTTVDPALRLPYYPRVRGVSLPGLRDTPAWGVQATRDPALIAVVRERWRNADLEDMVETLAALMERG